MDTTIYHATIVGDTPLIQNSTNGMLPGNPLKAESQLLQSLKGSKRTAGTEARLSEIDTELAVYWDDNDRPMLPPPNIRANLEKAARTLREGPQVRRGLIVFDTEFTSDDYASNASKEEIIKTVMWHSVVKIGGKRLVRARARFRNWTVTAKIEAMDDLVDRAAVERWFKIGGRLIGLGDWRPDCSGIHGRFTLTNVTEERG